VLSIRTFLPKPQKVIGDRKESFQTLLFTATLVPEVHQFLLTFAPRHELVDLNREMASNKNSVPPFILLHDLGCENFPPPFFIF